MTYRVHEARGDVKYPIITVFLCAWIAACGSSVESPGDAGALDDTGGHADGGFAFKVHRIGAGLDHTCAVTKANSLKCWGGNYLYQLGDGTTIETNLPGVVSGLTAGVVSVSTGAHHTCALMDSGGVKCWGSYAYPMETDATLPQLRAEPTDIQGFGEGVIEIASGGYHTCAISTSNKVKCWGNNSSGQLGDGTTENSLTPVDVNGLEGYVKAIAAGYKHTCALHISGLVKCWGQNNWGQIGAEGDEFKTTAVTVGQFSAGARSIAAGAVHSCVVDEEGWVKCWGDNRYGQLGDGTTNKSVVPVSVVGPEAGVKTIAGGDLHTCAITGTGAIWCWGSNRTAQFGNDSYGKDFGSLVPVKVSGSEDAVEIAAGGGHTCVLSGTGTLYCWGDSGHGQIGDAMGGTKYTPVDVVGLGTGIKSISAGINNTCVLHANGTARCWGDNSFGQQADGSMDRRDSPVETTGIDGPIKSISTGDYHTLFLLADGRLLRWGQLSSGMPPDQIAVVVIADPSADLTAVSAGGDYDYGITSTGLVKRWSAAGSSAGTDLNAGTGMVAVDAGYKDICILAPAGGLLCGEHTGSLKPVSGLESGVEIFSVGGTYSNAPYEKKHACAVLKDGIMKCWGHNWLGQLGDGTINDSEQPVVVDGLSGVTAISAGNQHTCAVSLGGDVQCWGNNYYGMLGDGTNQDRNLPAPVSGLSAGVVGVAAGRSHTCALISDNRVQCWGSNAVGQLGDGTSLRLHPVAVSGF